MSDRIAFTFEGRTIEAPEGRSIGAALHAAGVRTLSWSSKYRRPRGLRCMAGVCPGCTVQVDGLGGVQACITPLRGGEVVSRIRPRAPWLPVDRFSRLAPAGFHAGPVFRLIARIPWLWLRAERILAQLAGESDPPAPCAVAIGGFEVRAVDLLVIGAGRTGLAAAIDGAQHGRSVLVVDRDHEPGGSLLSEPGGRVVAMRLVADARAAGAEILLSAIALGRYEGEIHGIAHPGGLMGLHAREVVHATGWYDRELALPDGDRPGVMLASGVRRLLVRDGVPPGTRAVIVEVEGRPDGQGEAIAALLAAAGVEVVARCSPEEIRAIRGRPAVTSVRLRAGDVRCDLVVIAAGRRPADEVPRQADVAEEPRVAQSWL